LRTGHDYDLIRMTARCSEITQVRCDCLAEVRIAAIRRIAQQVNAFFCQNLRSESLPDGYWKFVDGWDARHQGDARSRPRRTEIELISNACIRNCFYSVRDASWALNWFVDFRSVRGQKCFRKQIGDERSGSGLREEVAFGVKF